MIPTFPTFVPLTWNLKADIEKITLLHDPYSDHNFTGLFNYDISEFVQVSLLNDNLVVRSKEYLSQKPFLTFFGTTNVYPTIQTLLQYSKEQLNTSQLQLIPEATIHTLSPDEQKTLTIIDDRDNYDYIFTIKEMIDLSGSGYRPKPNEIHTFHRKYPDHIVVHIDHTQSTVKEEMRSLFDQWKHLQEKTDEESDVEYKALCRFLDHADHPTIHTIGIRHENRLIAFCMVELLGAFVVAHFAKSNYEYRGINTMLFHATATQMYELGARYWNHQQDMGIVSMRHSKESWQPTRYLKKYTVSWNEVLT